MCALARKDLAVGWRSTQLQRPHRKPHVPARHACGKLGAYGTCKLTIAQAIPKSMPTVTAPAAPYTLPISRLQMPQCSEGMQAAPENVAGLAAGGHPGTQVQQEQRCWARLRQLGQGGGLQELALLQEGLHNLQDLRSP